MASRTFAIGDIHGCRRALEALLSRIAPVEGDLLVFLGDYVDRGPDSQGVIELLLSLRTPETVFVRGNHEEMMLSAQNDPAVLRAWQHYGGDRTLDSYTEGRFPASVARAHWRFLEQTVAWHQSETTIFCHAPIRADRPVEHQTSHEWRWTFDLPAHRHVSGKRVVCGHATQADGLPMRVRGTTFIDTGAYLGGWLTALNVDADQAFQANEHAEIRVLEGHEFRGVPL